jgi:GTP-binding protein HflX
LFERPGKGENAVLVHLDLPAEGDREDLDEFCLLAVSAGARLVGVVTGRRTAPHPRWFVGRGKLDQVREVARTGAASLVMFDHALTPVQERNLEQELGCRVLDRTGLILDIFAQRARSHEGKLQVELAQLRHLSTRLVRGWTHLERQKGGIGLRGPGETQLETDRRLIGGRIKQLRARLERVRRQRAQGRRSRSRAQLLTVSLVGYTNAGKSTLFQQLTGADVYQADQLFATLDPTLRRMSLPGAGPAVLADTVGFIRHLPHELVAAFRSTLEETREASLLLHVVDAHDPERDDHKEQVLEVLSGIGADRVPVLEVYNKIDLLPDAVPRLETDPSGQPARVWVSARSGAGLDLIGRAVAERLGSGLVRRWLRLGADAGRLRARLFELGAVRDEHSAEDGNLYLRVELQRSTLDSLCREHRCSEAPEPPRALAVPG